MSDYDRSKYHKKKFPSQNKEASSSYGRSYYGRRSPTGGAYKPEKDPLKETKTDPIKVKQPTILLKARDNVGDQAASPKRAQKEQEVPSSLNITISNTDTHTPAVNTMRKSVKFLEDSMLCVENLQEFVQENCDFLVVGIVGAQGVGKSTILNLITHNKVSSELESAIFKNCSTSQDEEYGDIKVVMDKLSDTKIGDKTRYEVFKIQSGESYESNSNTTRGIDAFITSNRVILLDCQPFMSVSVLDELVQSENKRSNIVSEFIPLENSAEIQSLQLTTFLMSVCHVLIVVQDYFFDSNVLRFLQTAEMLKPTHFNPEDELDEHFPHLLIVQNKAQMEDFSPRKFKKIQEVYGQIFKNTKLQKDSLLGLATSKLISCLNEENCGEAFNVFLIPEYQAPSIAIYSGHPSLEELVMKLRSNILGALKSPLTHIPLTEKTWLVYCSKVWENVRKSSFFVEYTKLMP